MTEARWLTKARQFVGTREAPGAANNSTILGWAKRLGVKIIGIVYSQDSTPWCGLFIANVMNLSGIAPPPIAVRAKAWATWGDPLTRAQLAPGAVLVFERAGGGHVSLYVGEDTTHYHCLGGNQGDAVNITRIEKSRCIARRWPKGEPIIGSPRALDRAGAPVSKSEA